MKKYDVIIIGSGLGGLACGYILAKNGKRVCVLEQNGQLGGCLQTFRRSRMEFDTGFHYVGGLDEGEPLHRLFNYLNLLDLPWHRLDSAGFDEVVIGDEPFLMANGFEGFTDTLAHYFPAQRKNLVSYASFLKEVGNHLFESFKNPQDPFTASLFSRSAYAYLNETIGDPLLRNVLSGTSVKMELDAERLPLYVFAQIHSAYIQSAWRLRGGGAEIVNRLSEQIQALGGEVRTHACVTCLKEANGKIAVVEVNEEETLSADWVISNAHPAHTLALVNETKMIRNIYRKRITSLENTIGMFTVNVSLKPDYVPYLNRNIYLHTDRADLWHPNNNPDVDSLLISYQVPSPDNRYASGIDLLTPMSWQEVERWKGQPLGRRGDDYAAFKAAKAEACLHRAAKRIPELRSGIDKIYTSSPLTYHSYTQSPQGSAYGVRKDYNSPMLTLLPPRSPIPNLLWTGQSLNLHGILGVSVTAFLTCAEIVGMDILYKQLMDK